MNFILERLNERDRTRFVLDKNGEFISCGRQASNKIICLSHHVSRKHCMFLRSDDKLYVTDLASSNGIFINGEQQEAREQIELHENDVIGIGSANVTSDNDTEYIYKIRIRPIFSNNVVKEEDSNMTKEEEESNMENAVFNHQEAGPSRARLSRVSAPFTNRIMGEKCKSNSTNCDNSVPHKIKCTNGKEHNSRISLPEEMISKSSHNNQNPHNSRNTNNSIEVRTDTVHAEVENDDIEIIHTSLSKNINKHHTENSDLLHRKHLNNNNNNIKSNMNYKTFQYPTTSKNYETEVMDICSDDDMFDSDDKKNKNKIHTENVSKDIHKTNDPLNMTKNSNSTHANNGVDKTKNKQRMDDEKAATVNCKTTCNESPVKLKEVKQESKTRFSEIDIIDISDEEDGLFPYSQLFDSKFEESMENKVKMQCDNDDQNTEKNDQLDVDDEVVILSDSEDENNPWLERLSRSQIMNEDNKSNIIIKDELDLGIWEADDIANIIQSVTDTFKIVDDKDTSFELDTNIDDKNKSEDNNNNADLMKENVIDIDVEPSKNHELNLEDTNDTSKRKTDIKQDNNKLVKNKNKDNSVIQSVIPHISQVPGTKDTSLELDTKVNDKNKDKSNADLMKRNAMDVGISKTREPNLKNTSLTSKRKTDIKQDTNKLVKNKNKDNIIQSVIPHTSRVPGTKDTSLELDKNVDDKNKKDNNSNSDLMKENAMDIDVGPFKDYEFNLENTRDTSKRKTRIKQDTNKLVKNKNKDNNIMQSVIPHTSQILDTTSLELDTKVDDKNKDKDKSNADLIKGNAMDVDVGASKTREPNLENTSDTSKGKTDVEQGTNKLDKSYKEKVSVESTKLIKEKKSVTTAKLIAALPNLPKRRRQTDHKDKISKTHEKKSTKEALKSPIHSPDETKAGPCTSKDEKRKLLEKRKEKLKEIAAEEKRQAAKNNQNIQRRIAKPRAKISLKNRGDFLCENLQEPCETKSLPDKSTKVSKSSTNRLTDQANMLKKSTTSDMGRNQTKSLSKDAVNATLLQQTTTVPESSINHLEDRLTDQTNILKKSTTTTSPTSNMTRNPTKDVYKNTENSMLQALHSKPFVRLNKISVPEQVPEDTTEHSRVSDKGKKHNNNNKIKRSKNMSKLRDRSTEHTSASVQEEPKETPNVLKSILVIRTLNSKSKIKKKVVFSEEPSIRKYEIDSHNSMKKLKGKDAPIPTDKLTKKSTVCANWVPKLEEFLLRIFMWNPVWLDEQHTLNKEPPIVPLNEIQKMKLRYDSYEQYYKVAMPLLLHEIWCTMTKDLQAIEKSTQRATMICSIVQNSITRIPIPSTNFFLTTMMIEVLVDRVAFNKPKHPIYGDLVVLQLNDKKRSFQTFAYITNMYSAIITDFTHYNKELGHHVQNPYAVITYTLLTRPLDCDIPVNRMHRVRTVMYLRANMRMVQALQYLPQSPLLNHILNPTYEDYDLPPMTKSPISLVTKENLNPKQLEAVFRVSQTVLNKESKLCFIQGPPGTGKSKVIVNLVSQILHESNNENANNKKPLKILICAPSNAAIDEVALRLLNIRSTLKENRTSLNMVRIGRPEAMHPSVKTISVTELAKRHLRNSASNKSPIAGENIAAIEADLNSLYLRSTNSQIDEAKRQELERKLLSTKIDYELKKSSKTVDELTAKERAKYMRMAENLLLSGADIITCTLSSCYTNLMESKFGGNKERISVCIVDEATQSCEAETLIPLMLGVNTLILVGDPNQLPATVLSQRAKKMGLDKSIFWRMQCVFASQSSNPIIMLNTQYRMDYSISYWPNRFFYEGKLKNADWSRTSWNTNFPFHGYKVLDHNSAQNDDKFSNSTEAVFVANIIYAMLMFPKWEENTTISLGVLTPYNNQRTLVLNKINEKVNNIPDRIRKRINFEVNTVDGFQGQERDVIIMSCVRSHGIGFLSDKQRLCVALTRAKYSLILCGNFNTFRKDPMWQALLTDALTRGNLCSVDANATPSIIKKFILK